MPTLTGVNPLSPTPSNRREILFAQGVSSGSSNQLRVLLYANKTSAGSETVETISTSPIADLQDARDRFGARSEMYHMYRVFVRVDPGAQVFGIAVTDAGGTAASKPFVFANTSGSAGTCFIDWGGQTVSFAVNSGDTAATIAGNAVTAINNAYEGTWPFTAARSTATVTCTAANTGPRGDYVIGRIRMRFDKATSVITTTITPGSLTNGATPDDFTTALGVAANGDYAINVFPCFSTSALTTTDTQAGEAITTIATNRNPTNGKSQYAFFGLVGTPSEAVTAVASAGGNSASAYFFHQENNPWSPGMLAAHHAAIVRVARLAHPGFNINGYANSDVSPYDVPRPYAITDEPTAAEVDSMLNNGISPIAFSNIGAAKLVRFVTSRSFIPGTTTTDYRCREGHIPFATDYFWESLLTTWDTIRQPNVANDLAKGAKPMPLTSYPADMRRLAESKIDNLAGPNPDGLYNGPILASDEVPAMKSSIVTDGPTYGRLGLTVNTVAVKHLIGSATKIRETSPAY